MIAKIVLENFMAHEHTELELGPGVNALTGPNNTGKSAIVEGLRCVATNPVPKHYIRHGAKEARVTLEMDDGTKVVWVRKKRSSGYELWHPGAEEPQEYWKFGRRPPEDVLKVMRLDLVELETGGEIDVHVGNQREPVFLLNQPGSNAAAFFAASTESAHLLAMQNTLKRRTQDAKRRERELEARLAEIEGEMDRFSPLPSIGVEVETALELESAAKKLQEGIPVLENVISSAKKLSETLVVRQASATVLKEITPAPQLQDISGLRYVITQLEDVEKIRKRVEATAKRLDGLGEVPVTWGAGRLATLCEQLQALDQGVTAARNRQSVTASMVEPPALENTAYLSSLIDEIVTLTYRGSRGARWQDALQNVAEPPEVSPPHHLQSLLAEMRGVMTQQQAAQGSLDRLENQLGQLKKALSDRVNALGHCPTCGSDMNTEEFLDRRHRHDA